MLSPVVWSHPKQNSQEPKELLAATPLPPPATEAATPLLPDWSLKGGTAPPEWELEERLTPSCEVPALGTSVGLA